MRSYLVIVLHICAKQPCPCACFIVVIDVPPVDISKEEIGIGHRCRNSAEHKVAGADVPPIGVVLVHFVELAADFQCVLSMDQRKYIGPRVCAIGENGMDTAANTYLTKTTACVDGDVREDIAGRVRAVSRL